MKVIPFDPHRPRSLEDDERHSIQTEHPASFALTDYGNAERLVHRHGHAIRFCMPRRRWFTWDGKRWALDDSGVVIRLAKLTVRGIYAEAHRCDDEDRRKALAKHAKDSEKAAKLQAMMLLAQSEPNIPVRPDELNRDAMRFNVENGTIDLRTGQLRPHDRADLITRLSPVIYQADAKHELWDRFITEATGGDVEFAAYLQRLAGYALTGFATELLAHGRRTPARAPSSMPSPPCWATTI